MAEQNETAKRIAGRVLQRILDFDDRTSPEDQPDMLLVTGQELTDLIEEEVSEALATPVSEAGGEAIAFITKLVHMQSGQGWSRAVVRDAAANFLKLHGIAITGHADTTAEIAALAKPDPAPASVDVREAAERAWNSIADSFHQWSELGHDETDDLVRFAAALAKPASSPAGGDVVERIADVLQQTEFEQHMGMNRRDALTAARAVIGGAPATEGVMVTPAMVNAAWNAAKHRRMTGTPTDFREVLKAALSQSTSAGRGE